MTTDLIEENVGRPEKQVRADSEALYTTSKTGASNDFETVQNTFVAICNL